jgi:cell division protein FtsI/penicillin-binding protein 2
LDGKSAREKEAVNRKRILIVGGLLALWAVIIAGRLVDLQIVQHKEYCRKAVSQQERTKVIPAARGSILDRNGKLLAVCRKADTVYIAPADITNVYHTARALSEILGLERQAVIKTCRRNRAAIFVKRMVPADVADRIRTLNLAGVGLKPENDRHYPQGQLACHVLGFTDLENRGNYGVEQEFNKIIAGRDGSWFFHRDALGRSYGPAERPATAGSDLVLTIDEVIQYHTERALEKAMAESRAITGSVVVMDVWDGDILALANRPGFDPNDYGNYDLDRMSNLAVTRIYEPGSTFKLITMAAALEAGLDLERKIDCGHGRLKVGGRWIHDHKSFGDLTPAEIIAFSSNVGAMNLGMVAGSERLQRMITSFGFGEKTGIRLPGEEKGLVKPLESWSGRTCATISFGQEVSVTPLQLCRAVAAIAADGVLRVPRLVMQVQDREGRLIRRFKPETGGRAVPEKTAAVLRQMMAGVVEFGTGGRAASDHYQTAGKTGTAQRIVGGKYSDSSFVASFAGFAPYHRPRIAVVVVLSDVRRPNYHGGQVAAPVFREVVEAALRRLAVPSSLDEVLLAEYRRPQPQARTERAEAG